MYNEEILLPHFLRHYSSFADRIILFDNESTDRSVEIARKNPLVELRSFKSNGYDEATVLHQLACAKTEFSSFDWLYFPDIDELIISMPFRNERELLAGVSEDILTCRGYCMIEKPGDAPFDARLPISRQRKNCFLSKAYSKPVIARGKAGLSFHPGKHYVVPWNNATVQVESNFYLIHAELIDFQLYRYRKNRRALSAENVKMGWCVNFNKTEAEHRSIWDGYQKESIAPALPDWGELYS